MSQIFVGNPEGTEIQQVTHGFETTFDPAWSPDGSKIAFIGHHDDPSTGGRVVSGCGG